MLLVMASMQLYFCCFSGWSKNTDIRPPFTAIVRFLEKVSKVNIYKVVKKIMHVYTTSTLMCIFKFSLFASPHIFSSQSSVLCSKGCWKKKFFSIIPFFRLVCAVFKFCCTRALFENVFLIIKCMCRVIFSLCAYRLYSAEDKNKDKRSCLQNIHYFLSLLKKL